VEHQRRPARRLTRRLAGLESRANDAVFDAYEITAAHRAIVDAEYGNG